MLYYNQISELKGLEHLDQLRSIDLYYNNIPIEVIKQVGIKNPGSGPEDNYHIDIKKAVEKENGVNAETKISAYHKLRKLVNKQFDWKL